jgi:hypothetical protein
MGDKREKYFLPKQKMGVKTQNNGPYLLIYIFRELGEAG